MYLSSGQPLHTSKNNKILLKNADGLSVYEAEINSYIDSLEYQENFGEGVNRTQTQLRRSCREYLVSYEQLSNQLQ